MFGRRGRRDEPSSTVYQLRQKMLSIGDDYWINDDQGDRVYHVDGKALRLRDTFKFEDAEGRELFKIQAKALHIRDTMAIERDGDRVATVHKAMISPVRDRLNVDIEGGETLKVRGHILDHEYEIRRDDKPVASVSKKWFRIRDTYGVEVAEGEDAALLLAVAVCVDDMTHEGR
jgi:uncharacterized protein YxjI